MTLDARPWHLLERLADQCIADWHATCAKVGRPVRDRSGLNAHVAAWMESAERELKTQYTPTELAAVFAYIEAHEGFRRGQRPRFLVWQDREGRVRFDPPSRIGNGRLGWLDAPNRDLQPTMTCDDDELARDPGAHGRRYR